VHKIFFLAHMQVMTMMWYWLIFIY